MNLLKELAFFLQENNVKSIETYMPLGSKLRKLYELACADESISDKQAADRIYAGLPSDKKYLMLKRNLTLKLTDLVLLSEGEDGEENNHVSLRLAGEKQLGIAEKLLLRNIYHNAEKIILKVLRNAEKQQMISLQAKALQVLRKTYALKGDFSKTKYYHVQSLALQQVVNFEQQAAGLLELVVSKIKYSTASCLKVAHQADQHAHQVSEWAGQFDSPLLKLYILQLQCLAALLRNEPDGVLSCIDRIEKLQAEHELLNGKNQRLNLLLKKAQALILLTEMTKAKGLLNECLRMSSYRAFNRYEVDAVYFRLLMLKGEYFKAAELSDRVLSSERYFMLDKVDKAAWQLRNAFLFFVVSHFQQQSEGSDPFLVLNELLQQTQPLQRDKAGYFIQVWLLRMLLCVRNECHDHIFSEAGKLKAYFHRYLQNIPEPRTRAFLKSLYKAGLCSSLERFEYIEEKLMRQLKDFDQTNDPNELVPYSVLWNMIRDSFKRNLIL